MSEKAENDHTGEKQPEPSIQSIILAVDCEEIIATGIRPHPDYFPAVGYPKLFDQNGQWPEPEPPEYNGAGEWTWRWEDSLDGHYDFRVELHWAKTVTADPDEDRKSIDCP